MTKAIFSLIFISFCFSLFAQDKVQIFSGGMEHFRFENGSLIFKKSNNIAIGDSTLFNVPANLDLIAIGNNAGKSNVWGGSNTFIGDISGQANISGSGNTFLGANTGSLNNANNNTFIGTSAGSQNISGSDNTGLGVQALGYNESGSENVAVGRFSLYGNVSGIRNIAIGLQSLYSGPNTNSIAIGYHSLRSGWSEDAIAIGTEAMSLSNSDKSIAIGTRALQDNNNGIGNIGIGYQAGKSNASGQSNVFIGYQSGTVNSNGGNNTFLGYKSGFLNVSGYDNTFVGNHSGVSSKGSGNTLVGNNSGFAMSNANANTAIGYYSLSSNVSGLGNTAIGYDAMSGSTAGTENSAFGRESLSSSGGSHNVAIGAYAGHENSTGSRNVFLGYKAGYFEPGSDKLYIDNSSNPYPLIHGNFVTDEVGINGELGIGTEFPDEKLHVMDGNIKLENGNFFISNSDRIYLENSSGSTNSAQIYMDLSNILLFTSFAGKGMGFYTSPTAGAAALNRLFISKNGQISIPHVVDAGLTSNGDLMIGSGISTSLVFDQNEIMARNGTSASDLYLQNEGGNLGINSQGFAPASTLHIRHPNTGDALSGIRIQNNTSAQHWTIRTRSTSPGDLTLYSDNGGNSSWVGEFDAVSGAYSATSDARLKKDILPLQSVLSTLMLLNPATYQFKSQGESDNKRYIGLLAQDVAKYFPEAVRYDKEADLYHMNYDVFGVLAIKAIQELKQENELLKSELELINERLKRLEEK